MVGGGHCVPGSEVASRYSGTVMSTQKTGTQQASESHFPTVDGLLDSRLRVVEPIAVTWAHEDGTYIAEALEINEYGYGDSVPEAFADLQVSIAELYFDLDEDRNRLGTDLASVYAILARKLTLST